MFDAVVLSCHTSSTNEMTSTLLFGCESMITSSGVGILSSYCWLMARQEAEAGLSSCNRIVAIEFDEDTDEIDTTGAKDDAFRLEPSIPFTKSEVVLE